MRKKSFQDNGIYLEKHAKALLYYQQISDQEDINTQSKYRIKAIKYKNNLLESQEVIKALKMENQEKQIISELLLDIEEMREREKLLESELQEQKQLTQSAIQQLEQELQESVEDRLLQEQKLFQEKLTIQSNDAIEKLKKNFDEQLQIIAQTHHLPKKKRRNIHLLVQQIQDHKVKLLVDLILMQPKKKQYTQIKLFVILSMQKNLPGGNSHLKSSLHLHDIVYLGAHNSPMASCYGWKLYTQQNVTITEQFEKYGARHFKIPLHWHVQNGVPQIVIAHEEDGKSNCKWSLAQRVASKPEKAVDRLKELVNLTFKYPDEVIIMKLESKLLERSKDNGTLGWSDIEVAQKLHNLLVDIKAKQRVIRFQENNVPTLGWCRDNQKNILITIEPREQILGDLQEYTHDSYIVSAQVDWQTDPSKDVTTGHVARGKVNKNNGYIQSPFLEIHLNPENSFKLDIQYRKLYNQYDHVKKRFLQYNKHCGKMPNFVVADFVDQGDLSKIIDEINTNINQNDGFKSELL